jgi:preprotein translocase subunit YajC
MPASQTKKYRSTLDAMRSGTLKSGTTAGSGIKVNVNNYTDSNVAVKKNQNGELELTIREIARQQIAEQTPKLIATNLRNSNSRESKALGQSTYTRRKR